MTSHISDTTRYIATAIGGELNSPQSAETLPALLYKGTLQTRLGGGVAPPNKNTICALVLVGAFQTGPPTFRTQPDTFRMR